MAVGARMEGLGEALGSELLRVERGVTRGMGRATDGLTADLRDQTERAGLGSRVAKAWRGTTYPKSGESLQPAGFVHSKAPAIITTFSGDITIRPVAGSRYLWLPTQNVPRGRGRARMSPDQVEAHYGRDLVVRPSRGGNKAALMPATALGGGRKRGARGGARAGRAGPRRMIHMFTLVRFIRGQKLVDLEAAAQSWGAKVPGLIDQELDQ